MAERSRPVARARDLKDEWFATLISWLDHYLGNGQRLDIVGRARTIIETDETDNTSHTLIRLAGNHAKVVG